MGEARLRRKSTELEHASSVGLQTAGGRVNVRWDASRGATPLGQLAFFIEFLTLTGLWERWKNECPLFYTSPNAPEIGDVVGLAKRRKPAPVLDFGVIAGSANSRKLL